MELARFAERHDLVAHLPSRTGTFCISSLPWAGSRSRSARTLAAFGLLVEENVDGRLHTVRASGEFVAPLASYAFWRTEPSSRRPRRRSVSSDDAGLNRRSADWEVVNLDSAHLFAVVRIDGEGRSMQAIQCGVIFDVIGLEPDVGCHDVAGALAGP